MTTSTRPAQNRYVAYLSHPGLITLPRPSAGPRRTATAARSSAIPTQLRKERMRFMSVCSAFPAFRVDRPHREEQPEGDEAHVVDHVLAVDDPAREVVEMPGERQIFEDALHLRSNRP